MGQWCDFIVINVHAPWEDKDNNIKDSFHEEIEQLFDPIPMYHMKILLGVLMHKYDKRIFSN